MDGFEESIVVLHETFDEFLKGGLELEEAAILTEFWQTCFKRISIIAFNNLPKHTRIHHACYNKN